MSGVIAQLEISVPGPDELPRLFALAESVFAGRPGWSSGGVVSALEHDVLFVARELGEVAGYVALRREDDRTLVIEQVLVAPGHERHGVGRRLLAYAEGYAIREGAPALRVVVEADNHVARDLYRRLGFAPTDVEVFERRLPTASP